MAEVKAMNKTLIYEMSGIEFQRLNLWSQWEYSISDKRVERFWIHISCILEIYPVQNLL